MKRLLLSFRRATVLFAAWVEIYSSELEHTPFTLHINDELSTVRYLKFDLVMSTNRYPYQVRTSRVTK